MSARYRGEHRYKAFMHITHRLETPGHKKLRESGEERERERKKKTGHVYREGLK